jgi:hypothetical protein
MTRAMSNAVTAYSEWANSIEGLITCAYRPYELVSESSRSVIFVNASVKEDEGEAKVTYLKVYCISLPRETAL